MKKTIKIVLLILVSFIALFIGSLFLFSNFYGDEISSFVVSEMNKNLNVKVNVKSVEFSLFKRFPDAAIQFNDIIIFSSKTFDNKEFKHNTDTFLRAKELFLQFNVLDFLEKKYRIRKVLIKDAFVSVFIDKKGNNNFKILNDTSSSTSTSVSIDLKKVEAEQSTIIYNDLSRQISLHTFLESAFMKGKFSDENYDITSKIKGVCHSLAVDSYHLPRKTKFSINCTVDVTKNLYSLSHCKLQINDLDAKVNGQVHTGNHLAINIKTELDASNLNDVIIYVPSEYKKKVDEWEPRGKVVLSITTKGIIEKNKPLSIKVGFKVEDGSFLYKKKQCEISAQGTFQAKNLRDPASFQLVIDTTTFVYKQTSFSGHLSVNDFNAFVIRGSGYVKLLSQNIYDLATIDSTIVLNGEIFGRISFESAGNIGTVDEHIFDKISIHENLEVANLHFLDKKNYYSEVKNVSGKFRGDNDHIVIDTCSLNYFGTKIHGNGAISNFIKYIIFDNQTVSGYFKLVSNCINADSIMKHAPVDSSQTNLPKSFDIKADFSVSCLNYNQIKLENISGILNYNKGDIHFENLSCNAFKGNIKGDFFLSQLEDKSFESKANLSLKALQIDNMFISLQNFGQTLLTDKNLKGQFEGTVMFITNLNNNFSLQSKTLKMQCNTIIKNGQLINFEPMQKMSKFIDIDELKDIKFSTIKNNILISDEIITIPQMEVRSSAFNLTLSGTHHFNNTFTHRIQLYLSELLSKKRRTKHPDEYFGDVADDGLGKTKLPILIVGDGQNTSVSYDIKVAKEEIKERFKKEKTEIGKIFKDEFHSAKKDSTQKKQPQNTSKVDDKKFQVEFE